ncbi:hypothetical protein [Pedobacter sp. GR22-6]|uniref:hypothetical protein n=1 Tax=Pedobacter sp. GR22-6 TaxID=3127957 RepID=UPI00307EAFD6
MKHTLLLCLLLMSLQACQNQDEYKSVKQEVLDAHDKIMLDGERAIRNRMKLDTIDAEMDSLEKINIITDALAERRQVSRLQSKLDSAEEYMNDWMHSFQVDLPDKSSEEQKLYYQAERKKIHHMDSLFNIAIRESEGYLLKFKKK